MGNYIFFCFKSHIYIFFKSNIYSPAYAISNFFDISIEVKIDFGLMHWICAFGASYEWVSWAQQAHSQKVIDYALNILRVTRVSLLKTSEMTPTELQD